MNPTLHKPNNLTNAARQVPNFSSATRGYVIVAVLNLHLNVSEVAPPFYPDVM